MIVSEPFGALRYNPELHPRQPVRFLRFVSGSTTETPATGRAGNGERIQVSFLFAGGAHGIA